MRGAAEGSCLMTAARYWSSAARRQLLSQAPCARASAAEPAATNRSSTLRRRQRAIESPRYNGTPEGVPYDTQKRKGLTPCGVAGVRPGARRSCVGLLRTPSEAKPDLKVRLYASSPTRKRRQAFR